MTFRKWIEKRLKDEKILAIYLDPEVMSTPWEGCPCGYVPITSPWLDQPFDDGFGNQNCPNITVWTDRYILVTDEYDGSVSPRVIHRNPPEFS